MNLQSRRLFGRRSAFILTLITCIQVHGVSEQTANDPDGTLAQMAQRLTGGGSRTWVFTQIDITQGTSEDCTQGDAYQFNLNHSAVEEHCENGHLKKDEHHWSLGREGTLDVILTIDNQRYVLLFRQEPKGWSMKLRTPSASQTEPTVDKEYYYRQE
jgi:hypothetical protein